MTGVIWAVLIFSLAQTVLLKSETTTLKPETGNETTTSKPETGNETTTSQPETSNGVSPFNYIGFPCNPLLLIIIVGLICLYVLTVGFCIHKIKRLSRRLKGGRDGDTYASLQLPNISPEYDVLQVKNKHQKHTGTTQEENDDYQNPEDGNRPDSGAN